MNEISSDILYIEDLFVFMYISCGNLLGLGAKVLGILKGVSVADCGVALMKDMIGSLFYLFLQSWAGLPFIGSA